jgi:hypothetical protein
LPGFVLIGLPAPESSNGLLVPLAGHELGHSIWSAQRLAGFLEGKLRDKVISQIRVHWADYQALHPDLKIKKTDLETHIFALQTWTPAVSWALAQSEESFCDFVGLRIFGESYLHAFAYLLSPGWEGPRPFGYPNLQRRAGDLKSAADTYGVMAQNDYPALFEDLPEPPGTSTDKSFLLSLADTASASILVDLINKAGEIVSDSSISLPSSNKVEEIYTRFKNVVPAQGCENLSNILCAGWKAFHDKALWKGNKQIASRDIVLRELVLKTIEGLEIEQLGGGHDPKS